MHANQANPARWSAEGGTAFAEAAFEEFSAPAEKRPLFRELPAPQPFPIDALGPLAEAALAICNLTQAPLAMCGQSVLAATTLAVQAQRDVDLPGGGRKPLTGLYLTIAESGERKSAVDRLATAGIASVEEKWRLEWQIAQPAYDNEKEAYEAARAYAKRTQKGDRGALQKALAEIGNAPVPPLHPILIVSDPTPEALILLLATGRPMAGLMTDEGGELLGGAAFNDETRTRTAALLNKLWDGQTIKRIRVTTGATMLSGKRCSTHIMVQPVVADTLFGDEIFTGMGLMARMLTVAPESTTGTRRFREAALADSIALRSYNEKLAYLLQKPPVTKREAPDVLDPPVMQLNPEARLAWICFYNECELAAGAKGTLATIRAFAAKLAEHAGRLAAVLTVYDDPNAMEVHLRAMQSGIALARYYGTEMLRLHNTASVSPDLRLAQRLLTWWQERSEPSLCLTYIYQKGPNALRTSAAARTAVKILEKHGWVEPLPAGTVLDGKPRKEGWRLVP